MVMFAVNSSNFWLFLAILFSLLLLATNRFLRFSLKSSHFLFKNCHFLAYLAVGPFDLQYILFLTIFKSTVKFLRSIIHPKRSNILSLSNQNKMWQNAIEWKNTFYSKNEKGNRKKSNICSLHCLLCNACDVVA